MYLLERVKEYVLKWQARVQELWAERRYIRASLFFLAIPVGVVMVIILAALGVSAVANFLRRYYAQLIFAAFCICAFIAWLDKRKADKIEIVRQEQEIRERQNYTDRLDAAQTKDATYTTGAKVLFPVSRELGPLGIVPPAKLNDIYSPGRTVVKANGMVSLNLYLLQKDRETVDTDLMRHTLQTKIDQCLQAGEFPGIPEQHIYRGRVYSGFVVDMVRDSMGGFVEVYTVLTDDAYCLYRERRNLNSSILLPSTDRRDIDY